MTFVVIVWVSSLVVVLSALLCPGRLVATRSSPPFGWFLVFSLAPSGSVLVVAGAILGWHGQESGAKFFISVLNFTQPPQFTFTFPYIICCHHPALLPCLRYATLGSPPPCSRPSTEEATLCLCIPPPLPPLSCISPGELVATFLVGWRLSPVLPCMVNFHCHPKVDFTPLVL